MENEILDYDENWDDKLNYRKYYLLIESILICSIFIFNINGGPNLNPFLEKNLILILFFSLIIFYIVSPLIRFLRKESTSLLAFLYFLQNGFFILLIILGGGNNVKVQFFAKCLGLSALLLFNIIPHIELKKHNASKSIHFLLIFINLAITISIIGSWFYVSRSTITNPTLIILVGGFISLALLLISFFLTMRNWEKHSHLIYYFPRLLFAVSLLIYQFLQP